MELLLVRHAQPSRLEASEGRADPPLNEHGVEQARSLAAWLASEPVDALYTSPALRARQTAAELAEQLGLTPVVSDGLDEFDRGESSYVPVEELRASRDPRWEALARGELYGAVDPAQFRRQVVAAVEDVISRWPGGRVVAVSHAGAINAYVGSVLAVERAIWFAPAYTGVSRLLAAKDGRRSVGSLNETGHLHAAARASRAGRGSSPGRERVGRRADQPAAQP